jgi:hypothetical protein
MVFDTPLHIVMDTVGYGAIISTFVLFGLAIWHLFRFSLAVNEDKFGYSMLLGIFSPSAWYTPEGVAHRRKAIRYLLLSALTVLTMAGWAVLRASGRV